MEPEAAWTLWEIEETADYVDHSLVTVQTGMFQQCVDKIFGIMGVRDFCLFVCLVLPCEFFYAELRILLFGPKRDDVTGEWRKLHNEELNDLYCLPNILRVIKPRKMEWAWQVARMGRGEAYTGFGWGNLRERDYLGDSSVDGG
jgi:hypothetical protein